MTAISSISLFSLSSIYTFAGEKENYIPNDKINAVTVDHFEADERGLNSQVITQINVRVTEEWSPWQRVSNNLSTGSQGGGSISATQNVTWSTQTSGSIQGLGISTSRSVQSGTGYTLNVGPNRRVYMAHRARYQVTTGTRVVFTPGTGRTTYNDFTVRTPLFGEFALRNF